MSKVRLFQFQRRMLEETRCQNRVAYYMDMGTGKTFVGSEKLDDLGMRVNLVICQKSKVDDWIDHFQRYYGTDYRVIDLTTNKGFDDFERRCHDPEGKDFVGIINYDLVWRRPKLQKLEDFTLLLDESSLIQHETTKRSKFILKMNPRNIILLSGTPCNGTYETLWSQLRLLGWNITKWDYWNTFVDYEIDRSQGFPLVKVNGYKRVERLRMKLDLYGCRFLRSEEVLDLPQQMFIRNVCGVGKDYRTFQKEDYVRLADGWELMGVNPLARLLYLRQLCGMYNPEKLGAFQDLMESTSGRVIVFYNFNAELEALKRIVESLGRPYGVFNGAVKNMQPYVERDDAVLFIQYQAGAYGLNLQQGNRIVYFTPPLSSEVFEQSKKRIHRIGQKGTCWYHLMIAKGTVEERIYHNLERKRDYTQALFEKDDIQCRS